MKLKQLLFLLFTFSLVNIKAQLSEFQTQKIDSLFNSWNVPNHPGGTIGIMQNGEVVYSKAFGLASLEYQVPNTKETRFNIASVSKQFTAMGIVLLHQKGLLSIDDEVHKYLPDLPDFGEKITLRQMLHHTSGMRSSYAMLNLAGWRDGDIITNADVYRFMLNQKDLNFKPGDEFLYCNTGYILLAKVIARVTKEEFPIWMKTNIFEPLGMINTYVEDQPNRVVPNNATSYYNSKQDFFRASPFSQTTGSGNIHSTTKDLLTWSQNYISTSSNWNSAFEMLKTTDTLNSGNENHYGFGLYTNKAYGRERVQHAGIIDGFRSNLSTYPKEKISIVILTNFSSANSENIEHNIANILLNIKLKKKTKTINSIKTENENIFGIKQLTGSYKLEPNLIINISEVGGALHVLHEWDKQEYNINRKQGNVYEIPELKTLQFVFSELKNNSTQLLTLHQDGEQADAKRCITNDSTKIPLVNYTGKFYSPELESILDLILRDGKLVCHQSRLGDLPTQTLSNDHLNIISFGTIDIVRNNEGTIIGIKVSNGRALNVWFEKQKQNILKPTTSSK